MNCKNSMFKWARLGFVAGASVSVFFAGGAAERWKQSQKERRHDSLPGLPLGLKVGIICLIYSIYCMNPIIKRIVEVNHFVM